MPREVKWLTLGHIEVVEADLVCLIAEFTLRIMPTPPHFYHFLEGKSMAQRLLTQVLPYEENVAFMLNFIRLFY